MFCSFVFFFKQKTAYEMRISDWSSDVCSSDLNRGLHAVDEMNDAPLVVDPQTVGSDGAETGMTPDLFVTRQQFRIQIDLGRQAVHQIGRASCRERVCQYV